MKEEYQMDWARKIQVSFGTMLEEVRIPKMYAVRQKFSRERIPNLRRAVREEMNALLSGKTLSGMRIAVTAGSRGITGGPEILDEILSFFREAGAVPFVIPAMGSHGGGTADGQMKLLSHYGITPETMGTEFRPGMEVIPAGTLKNGLPVYFSAEAAKADGIFLWNKVKPHADFKGKHESGLVKMLVIGLGKHTGCASIHRMGFAAFPEVLPEAAEVLLKTQPVLGALGIVENAYDEPCVVRGALPEDLISLDEALLKRAKEVLPIIRIPEMDVLVVGEIGKNISGEGMDPNVTGRPGSYLKEGFESVKINAVVVLDVTPESDGNGAGIGMADITTASCVSRLDLGAMYTNSITAGILGPSRLPVILKNDREAILAAIRIGAPMRLQDAKLVMIRNTLELDEILVSEALLEECRGREDMEILGSAPFLFDGEGNLLRNC